MKKSKRNIATKYCIGCGLCESLFGSEKARLEVNESGFYAPQFQLQDEEWAELGLFCPACHVVDLDNGKVWGNAHTVCLGYASDAEIRYSASSGGVLTALACYLLDAKKVDAIMQIGEGESPWLPSVHVNRTKAEVRNCCGSRYVITKPLSAFCQTLLDNPHRKYAVIGRPCDIRALHALLDCKPEYQQQVPYLLSFFCAGTPSVCASEKMADQMGVNKKKVVSVRYRGNGWPGFSSVMDSDQKEYRMNYEESWGAILGRDLYPGCRFCHDGIGEAADIACGDAWYLNEDDSVCFEERDGRNVIFARTKCGDDLLTEAVQNGYIQTQPFDIEELKKMQPYQYIRKAQLRYKLLAMRTMGKKVPPVSVSHLKQYRKLIPVKARMRIYVGTAKRILQKKI